MNLADKILMRPVGALVPYASNSRTHTPAQIDKLCRSLKEFGFTNPILVDGENGIIAGHARLAAAYIRSSALLRCRRSTSPGLRPRSGRPT